MSTTVALSTDVTRRVLAASYENALTIIKAPPGAGKSYTCSSMVALHHADGRRVAVATPTRSQGYDLARTIGERFPHIPVIWAGDGAPDDLRQVSSTRDLPDGPHVAVATVAKWAYHPDAYAYDLLVVDEAFQVTDAAFARIAALADQMVLMGDPGQIAPVVTVDVAQWAADSDSPVRPAPDAVLARHPQVPVIELPATWRFGPDSARIVSAGFYDWQWGSNRPAGHLEIAGGPMGMFGPEQEIGGLRLPAATGLRRSDPALATAVADLAADVRARGQIVTETGVRPVGEMFVVAAHIDQVAAARAATAHIPDVVVDTAERLQGRQADVVFAWHPASGLAKAGDFQRDAGRLCVMLSRHRYAAMLIYRDGTLELPVTASGRTLAAGSDPVRQVLRAQTTLTDVLATRQADYT